jgi:hypothetical protein
MSGYISLLSFSNLIRAHYLTPTQENKQGGRYPKKYLGAATFICL